MQFWLILKAFLFFYGSFIYMMLTQTVLNGLNLIFMTEVKQLLSDELVHGFLNT